MQFFVGKKRPDSSFHMHFLTQFAVRLINVHGGFKLQILIGLENLSVQALNLLQASLISKNVLSHAFSAKVINRG